MMRPAEVSIPAVEEQDSVDARVTPTGSLENLSQAEIEKLLDTGAQGLYPVFRNCALAVLNSGSDSDNAKEIFERYSAFTVQILRHAWGIKLELRNAPASASTSTTSTDSASVSKSGSARHSATNAGSAVSSWSRSASAPLRAR